MFSYGSTAIPLFSPQYKAGYERTLPEAQEILPMNGQAIAPSSAVQDPNEQIAQFDALFKADQIDCLSIQSTGTDAFTKIVNDYMATGIPVFTVGVESNGNEFSNFTQISNKEGRQAAGIVVDYMKAKGLDFKNFAVSGGDPTQNWAQGRMQGFIDGITEAIPDAKFINTAATALVTTYDPAGTYDAYKAFIQGNPEVQVIENVDIGGEHAARAIADSGQHRQDLLARLEREHRPARCRRSRDADRRARPAVGRSGRLRGARLRRAAQERQGPAEHEHPEADHDGERRPGSRGLHGHRRRLIPTPYASPDRSTERRPVRPCVFRG